MVRRGSKAPKTVRALQQNLNQLGFKLKVDGRFDDQTEAALKKLQADNELKADGVLGSKTRAIIDHLLRNKDIDDDETKADQKTSGDAPWMNWAKRHLGQREIRGRADNPFVSSLFKVCGFRGRPHDETPWCAALVSTALEATHHRSTKSASAGSYDHFGKACPLKYGAIVTIRRKGGSGRHVAFFSHLDRRGNVVLLGGNQGNMLRYATFARSKVANIRWPA